MVKKEVQAVKEEVQAVKEEVQTMKEEVQAIANKPKNNVREMLDKLKKELMSVMQPK